MSQKEKKNKSANETLKIIEESRDNNNRAQKNFLVVSRVDKEKLKPKPEERVAERVKLRRQKSENKDLNYFLKQIKVEQKNIDIAWFKNKFNYERPDKMLKYFHDLEETSDYNQATFSIEGNFEKFSNVVKNIPKVDKKTTE